MKVDLMRDHAAERRLLGAMLLSPERMHDATDVLRVTDLSHPRHAVIWEALVSLRARNEAIDYITLEAELKAHGKLQAAGGTETIFSLTDGIPAAKAIEPLAKQLRRVATIRRHQERMMALLAESQEPIEDLDVFADRIESAFVDHSRIGDAPTSANDLMQLVVEATVEQAERKKPMGYATGLHDLDHVIGGLVPGELTVLAGRPGMGKSALGQRIALGVEQSSQLPVLIVSREMSKLLMGRRLAAAEARIDGNAIRTARMSMEQWESFKIAAGDISQRRIYVIDGKDVKTMLDVRRAARWVAAKEGCQLALIAIDYAQIMKHYERVQSREQEVAAISADAVDLAKETGAHVLLLAQVNRECEKRADKRPTKSDLRESAALEHDADTILFVYRDEYYDRQSTRHGVAEIIIDKNRSGPTGTVEVAFNAAATAFSDLHYGDHR